MEKFVGGPLPLWLGSLTSLNARALAENNIIRLIPISLATLVSLGVLELNRNSLTGTIPNEFESFSDVEMVRVDENQLTGTIPTAISITCTNLLTRNTNLNGTIPTELAVLTSLRSIAFDDNFLSGTIADLTFSTNLLIVRLESNKLVGSIPETLFDMTQLVLFAVNSPIPSTVLFQPVLVSRSNWKGSPCAKIGSLVQCHPLWVNCLSFKDCLCSKIFFGDDTDTGGAGRCQKFDYALPAR